MANQILLDTSFGLVRTNVKITSNVKLLVDSFDNLYLESFDSNKELSSSKFKAYKINPASDYSQDVFNFYDKGKFPKELAYALYESTSTTKVLDKYSDQYEMFYNYGTRANISENYTEDMKLFAPIWLNKNNIPNYFIIFRVDGPVTINTANESSETSKINDILDQTKFVDNIIKKSTLIKTFNLKENSNIGKYLRNHINHPLYPQSTLFFDNDKYGLTTWNGISYDKGGFASKGEMIYQQLITEDKTIIETEYFITKGFERNAIIASNLINLEFLFSDENANDYDLHRYFGLYVNEIEEGSFVIDGEAFNTKWNIEKSQLPKPPSTKTIVNTNNLNYTLNNDNGILLYLKNINTITDLPSSSILNSLASYFYVKDKNNIFYNIKNGSTWKNNELRLAETKINIGNFVGVSDPLTYANVEILESLGKSHSIFTINDTLPHGFTIKFYDGNNILQLTGDESYIGEVSADSTLTIPGQSNYHYFSNAGTIEEIAEAMTDAINNIDPNKRLFEAIVNKNTIIIQAKFAGSNFNRLRFVLNELTLGDHISYFPNTNELENNFVGGTDKNQSRLKIKYEDISRFNINRYVKTDTGYGKIKDIVYYNDNISLYQDYRIVIIDGNQPYVDSLKQVSLFELFEPTFGRFSMYPIKDFDTDFYSTEYFEQGELFAEADEYNKVDSIYEQPIEKSSNPDILDFYSTGFGRLEGILEKDNADANGRDELTNEYDRLKENYLKELSTISRVIPYVNKWVYQDGKDVRNNDYRLNFSDAFGLYNFSPSAEVNGQDPDSFTHEWYLLSKYPNYFTDSDLQKSWSYFDTKVYDNIEQKGFIEFQNGFFQDITKDNFLNYFVVDRLNNGTNYITIDKQFRYNTFKFGNTNRFAETFFRGIKILVKQRSDAFINDKININYNLSSLNFVKNTKFNGYKFSCVLIPHQNIATIENPIITKHPTFQIKIVENKKWKTITMMIFLTIDYPYFDNNLDFIDRTLLYALKHNIAPSTGDQPFPSPYNYEDIKMQGAIDFISSRGTFPGPFTIKGMTDKDGVPTKFLDDIKVGPNGKYNKITFTINSGGGAGVYVIDEIVKIVNDNTLIAGVISRNGSTSVSFPSSLPMLQKLKEVNYYVIDGGYEVFKDRLKKASFSNIQKMVNQGDPEVIYESVEEDGTINYDQFLVELITPNEVIKPTYITRVEDDNKPVSLNLSSTIGYKLIMDTNIKLTPYYRQKGYYEPKFIDVIKYEDPYITKGYVGTYSEDLTWYEKQVFDLVRHTNTQFNLNSYFGIINNMFYHKVNVDNPDSILELSKNNSNTSVYPLIHEIGIDKKNFYLFSSNWDQGYYTYQKSKILTELVLGTRSQKEIPSFFASKVMTIPSQFILDTFTYALNTFDINIDLNNLNEEIFYSEINSVITLNIFIEKKLRNYLHDGVYNTFVKYINPLYSYGSKESIEDDVTEYINQNILPRYKISGIDLYIKQEKMDGATNYLPLTINNSDKLRSGMKIFNNFQVKGLNNSSFDISLIYNKILGYKTSIGLSIKIDKK